MWENIKSLMEAAEQGDAKAQTELADRYRDGKGIDQDYTKAVEWYRKAAEQGDVVGQRRLGVRYLQGQGIEKDSKEAFYWCNKAAEQNDVIAMNNLGACYIGFEQNYEKAVEWFTKAAEQGLADAQLNLGLCYEYGFCDGTNDGNEVDIIQAWNAINEKMNANNEKAFEWYKKAAEQGNVDAQFKLGEYYRDGKGVVQDLEKAVEWFTKAAEQGHAKAKENLEKIKQTQKL